MERLFKILTGNIHFNGTKLDKESFNQCWEVPDAFISIIGLNNGKKPIFYYGLTENYMEEFKLIKGTSDNGNKFLNARLNYVYNRSNIIENEKYVVANGFDGLLLCININRKKFTGTFEEIILNNYENEDEHIVEVLERMKERNNFESIEESARYIANRDYNWLIGRLKYIAGLFNYSGEGYWLLPLKTNLKITEGIELTDDELIVNLENADLFKNYIAYVDTTANIVRYNVYKLCKKRYSLVDEVKKSINDNNCPWCGGELRTIKTKKGEFLGCSNYPKCMYRRFEKPQLQRQ